MNQTFFRNPLYLGAAAIGALILLGMSVTVVPETQQAIISSYGKVDRVVNAYRKGEVFGKRDLSPNIGDKKEAKPKGVRGRRSPRPEPSGE